MPTSERSWNRWRKSLYGTPSLRACTAHRDRKAASNFFSNLRWYWARTSRKTSKLTCRGKTITRLTILIKKSQKHCKIIGTTLNVMSTHHAAVGWVFGFKRFLHLVTTLSELVLQPALYVQGLFPLDLLLPGGSIRGRSWNAPIDVSKNLVMYNLDSCTFTSNLREHLILSEISLFRHAQENMSQVIDRTGPFLQKQVSLERHSVLI